MKPKGTDREPLIVISVGRDPDCSNWVRRFGGKDRIAEQSAVDPLSGASGLLLTGGEDVDSRRYGDEPRHCTRVNPPRDDFEFSLLEQAFHRQLPVLAVCRGMQLLVIALGGTLYQDLDRELPVNPTGSRVQHRSSDHKDTTHPVQVEAESRLARLIQAQKVPVNSHHHQGVRDLPPALSVAARSPDGVIECVESRHGPFTMGVQWHPERWPDRSSELIMRAFLIECETPASAADRSLQE